MYHFPRLCYHCCLVLPYANKQLSIPLTIISYFSAERKAAIPLEDATVKLSDSYKTSLSSGILRTASFNKNFFYFLDLIERSDEVKDMWPRIGHLLVIVI